MNVADLLQDSPSEDRRRTSNGDSDKRQWPYERNQSNSSSSAVTTPWPTSSNTPPTTTTTALPSWSSSPPSTSYQPTQRKVHKSGASTPSYRPTNSPNLVPGYGVGVADPSPMYQPPATHRKSTSTTSPTTMTSPPLDRERASPWGPHPVRPGSQNNLSMEQWEREREWERRHLRQNPLQDDEYRRPPTSKRPSQESLEDGEPEDRVRTEVLVLQHRMPPPPGHFEREREKERERLQHLPPPPQMMPPYHHRHHPHSSHPPGSEPVPQRNFQTQFHTQFVSALQQPLQQMPGRGSPMPPMFVESRDGRPMPPRDIQREREQRDRERERKEIERRRDRERMSASLPPKSKHREREEMYREEPYPRDYEWRLREREREERELRERERQSHKRRTIPPEPTFLPPPPHRRRPEEIDQKHPLLDRPYPFPPAPPPYPPNRFPEPVQLPEWEKEREFQARHTVHIGTFVWPKIPFPYFFPGVSPVYKQAEEGEEKEKENAKPPSEDDTKPPVKPNSDILDVETRTTIYIPSGFLPSAKSDKPNLRIWGGGIIPPPGRVLKSHKPKSRQVNGRSRSKGKSRDLERAQRRRRIYTDDSDLFLCALHSGFITWKGTASAKEEGKDLKLDIRIMRVEGAKAAESLSTSQIKKSEERKEEMITHFVGGIGERYFSGDKPKVASPSTTPQEPVSSVETIKIPEREEDEVKPDIDVKVEDGDDCESDEEDDGRSIQSCSWGSGHDGSGIEIIGAEFVLRGTAHKSSGLGRQNRGQRMREYALQRSALLTESKQVIGVKRRRSWEAPPTPRRMPNATVLDPIVEVSDEEDENERMVPATLRCSPKEEDCMKRSVLVGFGEQPWFKYDPRVLKDSLFPSEEEPPMKRRRVNGTPNGDMDIDEDRKPAITKSIILQSKDRVSYLFAPVEHRYNVSKLDAGSSTLYWSDVSEDQLGFLDDGVSRTVDGSNVTIPVERWKWTV